MSGDAMNAEKVFHYIEVLIEEESILYRKDNPSEVDTRRLAAVQAELSRYLDLLQRRPVFQNEGGR